jgi:RNA recognition motif-containing protein
MKLFVGNLPFSIDSEGLRRMFEDAGFQVDSASVVQDRMTQRSRGFGFVETPQGQEAINALSGKSMEGRALTVNEARPMSNDRGFGGGGGGGGGRGPRGGGGGGGGRRDRY